MERLARLTFLLAWASSSALDAQRSPAPRGAAIAPFEAPWVRVFSDSGFQIAVDTVHVRRVDANSYLLWMQTHWLMPRRGATKRAASPFNRELIHTFLRCDTVAYKVARTVVSLDDGPPVDSVGAGIEAARRAGWRTAGLGSADAGAGAEACVILSRSRRSPATESHGPPPNDR